MTQESLISAGLGSSLPSYDVRRAGKLKSLIRRLLPRRVRPHRILRGPLRGERIVTSWHDYPGAILGWTERPLLRWFREHVKPGETWIDIGAHYGYTALALSRLVGPNGRVFAFEPMLQTCGSLERTRALNDLACLTVIPCGIGCPDSLELRRFAAVRGMADSTIGDLGARSESLLVARLDWLWGRLCDASRHMHGVKIDVQGMEIEAVQGMRGMLKEFHPKIVVEIHRGVDREHLLSLLESTGYSRMGVHVGSGTEVTDEVYLDDQSYFFPLA